HPDTATSLNNVGCLLCKQGDDAAARPYYEQALAIRKKAWGNNHPDIATSLNNIGWLLRRQGDLAAAREHFEQALPIRQKALGGSHPETALSLHNLGVVLTDQGEYAAARPHFEQALASLRRNLDAAAASQAERQQLLAANQARYCLDNFLSLISSAKLPLADVYPAVLSWKGAVTARQRALKQALHSPELAPTAKKLQLTATQLANLAFTTP